MKLIITKPLTKGRGSRRSKMYMLKQSVPLTQFGFRQARQSLKPKFGTLRCEPVVDVVATGRSLPTSMAGVSIITLFTSALVVAGAFFFPRVFPTVSPLA
eukprot:5825355-Pyramimonas_sp.AAC.1